MEIDADQVVLDAINEVADIELTLEGRADRGTSGGAILISLPDRRPGVVTRFLGPVAEAERTREVLSYVRRRGLPVPQHHLVVEVGADVFLVQERLPGRPPGVLTPAVVDGIIGLNDKFAGALRSRRDVPTLALCLTASGDPYPRHEVLAGHSERSRRLLREIRAIGQAGPDEAVGDDLLHIDLTPDNILFDEAGSVTGVVDWNLGVYRGDRSLALVKTRFDLQWQLQTPAPDPETVAAARHLDRHLEACVPVETLRRYWAHRLLYQLHWTLPSSPPDVVDWHLAFAEARLGLDQAAAPR